MQESEHLLSNNSNNNNNDSWQDEDEEEEEDEDGENGNYYNYSNKLSIQESVPPASMSILYHSGKYDKHPKTTETTVENLTSIKGNCNDWRLSSSLAHHQSSKSNQIETKVIRDRERIKFEHEQNYLTSAGLQNSSRNYVDPTMKRSKSMSEGGTQLRMDLYCKENNLTETSSSASSSNPMALLLDKNHAATGPTTFNVTSRDVRRRLPNYQLTKNINKISPNMTNPPPPPPPHHHHHHHRLQIYSSIRNGTTQPTTANNNVSNGIISPYSSTSGTSGINIDRKVTRELWKVIVTFLYMFFVMGFHSFVLVLAHERVPNQHPPLPDLILDNLPLLAWGFKTAETFLVILLSIFICIAIFHKQRLIILRRAFALMGTAYFLRSLTAIATSLSVPSTHLTDVCSPIQMKNMQERIIRAFHIWLGFGMSIQGVRTCGDYMFSGHTVSLTLLNLFITEYTPTRFYLLHIITWCMNISGIFFILAAHEHYTIDVFVAFYIASRLFHNYHFLANNIFIIQRQTQSTYQRWKTCLCFPFVSLLEGNCRGQVTNEYEMPFIKRFLRQRQILP